MNLFSGGSVINGATLSSLKCFKYILKKIIFFYNDKVLCSYIDSTTVAFVAFLPGRGAGRSVRALANPKGNEEKNVN